jgi:hypothetical protein
MDRALEAEHIRLTHLTTILGNAQLLQRWAVRASSLTDSEREAILRQASAIAEATRALHHALEPPASPPDVSSDAAHRRGDASPPTRDPAS